MFAKSLFEKSCHNWLRADLQFHTGKDEGNSDDSDSDGEDVDDDGNTPNLKIQMTF